ncbi:MAG TPA: helix-turn-helix transcriptional regulator [Rugosimonospora sp.]|nr:helix-turn-helix transcriptional regulator [Rugosimonospora sp.]
MWSNRGIDGEGLSAAEHETLRLLGTGLKDEAIARQLGVSMRTARRRISTLLTRLGAVSRFQAGAETARRGLV